MNLKEKQLQQHAQFLGDCNQILNNWYSIEFSDQFNTSLLLFKEKLGAENVFYNLEFACEKIDRPENAILYFCKICWNQIKGADND